jgi:hypothetical protein
VRLNEMRRIPTSVRERTVVNGEERFGSENNRPRT